MTYLEAASMGVDLVGPKPELPSSTSGEFIMSPTQIMHTGKLIKLTLSGQL